VLKPAWIAGTTRARLLLGRRLGAAQAGVVARCASLTDGVGALVGSAYGEHVQIGDRLPAAERGVADTLLWHLRILAGWLPGAGAALVRTLAARFELENIDARLAALAGDGREPVPFVLGGLTTVWARIEQARTIEEVAMALADSAWGAAQARRSAAELALELRVSWARRVWEAAPEAADWVAGAGALLVARELFVAGDRSHAAQLRRLPRIGVSALDAGTLDELRAALPAQAAWALADIGDPSELWRAELAWWRRVEGEAGSMRRSLEQRAVVVAVVALLAADARHAARALAAAAHSGSFELVELAGAAA
jgi:hypothetical protein